MRAFVMTVPELPLGAPRTRPNGAGTRIARTPSSSPARKPPGHFCSYCFRALANGAAFCDEDCEDAAWDIVPTVNGRIWEAPAERAKHG
jgi:hypothetical protein